jgi:hypothetical protein
MPIRVFHTLALGIEFELESRGTVKAPKTELIDEFTALTEGQLPEVRERVRHLFHGGVGPRGFGPITHADFAAYVVGMLCSPTHIDAAALTKKFGRLTGVNIPAIAGIQALEQLLPPRSLAGSLLTILADLIHGMANNKPYRIEYLEATLPPYDRFTIRVQPDDGGAIDLNFGPIRLPKLSKPTKPPESWPIKTTRLLCGEVIERLLSLTTADDEPSKSERRAK